MNGRAVWAAKRPIPGPVGGAPAVRKPAAGFRERILPMHAPLLLTMGWLCSACTVMPDGSRWGDAATLTPGWQQIRSSAVGAVRSPWVWAPLAGAALLQVDSWDEDIADWASDDNPVFGSARNADDWSDGLRVASAVGYGVSVVATPGGEPGGDWLLAKARGATVGAAAFAATAAATGGLKSLAARERPDGSGDDSLPSGHASTAAVFGMLTARNLQSIDVPPALRTTLAVGSGAITASTAWARVEAGRHYPSDILVGIALGNFMGAFFTDAFLGARPDGRYSFSVAPTPDGAMLGWDVRF